MSGLELLRRLADDLDDSRAWWLVKESRQRFWGCDDFSEVSLRDLLMEVYGKLYGETGGAEGSRLMPGGTEWPRFEDGEPVRIGDEAADSDGRELDGPVVSIELFENGFALHGDALHAFYGYEERVKRPAPKVLDADGVEIRVGDRLYDTETGCGRTVRAVNDNETVEFEGCENRGWLGKFLTHRAPVLAADGKPLRVGETVYGTEEGGPYVVANVSDEGSVFLDGFGDTGLHGSMLTHQRPVLAADGLPINDGDELWLTDEGRAEETGVCGEPLKVVGFSDWRDVECLDRNDIAEGCDEPWNIAPRHLTHERPDSWERIEDDATLTPHAYAQGNPGWIEEDSFVEFMTKDLVRRARALAGRDAK